MKLRRNYATWLAATAFVALVLVSGTGTSVPAGEALRTTPLRASTAEGVSWSDVTVPGAVCGAQRPIQLHDGQATVAPIPRRFEHDSFYGKHYVTVEGGSQDGGVVYGHLTRGGEDAALYILCTNGGGTADGDLLQSAVVFRVRDGVPSVIGIVWPQTQLPKQLPTLLQLAITPGRITVHEFFYGPFDATCCSTGRAITTWTYTGGHLRAGRPVVTRHPAQSLPSA